MTNQQIAQHPDVYERLRAITTQPGDSFWSRGQLLRRKFERACKDNWSWDDAMAAPDTANVAYYRKYHWYGSVA